MSCPAHMIGRDWSSRFSFLPNSVKYPQFQVWRNTDDLLWEFHRTIQAPKLFFVERQGFRQIDTVTLNQREKQTMGLLSLTEGPPQLIWRPLNNENNSGFRLKFIFENEIRLLYFDKLFSVLLTDRLAHYSSTSFIKPFQMIRRMKQQKVERPLSHQEHSHCINSTQWAKMHTHRRSRCLRRHHHGVENEASEW